MKDVEQKRQKLIGAYPGERWKRKVIGMREDEVIAVFIRLRNAGKI